MVAYLFRCAHPFCFPLGWRSFVERWTLRKVAFHTHMQSFSCGRLKLTVLLMQVVSRVWEGDEQGSKRG
jgi:hypothetical protein